MRVSESASVEIPGVQCAMGRHGSPGAGCRRPAAHAPSIPGPASSGRACQLQPGAAAHRTNLCLAGAVEAGAQRGQRGKDRHVGVALDRVEGVHARHGLAPGAVQALQRAQVHNKEVVLQGRRWWRWW